MSAALSVLTTAGEPTLLVAEVGPAVAGAPSARGGSADRGLTQRLATAVSCGAFDVAVEVNEGRVVGCFVDAYDAIAAAMAARRAVEQLAPGHSARVAVHSGEVLRSEDGRHVGECLERSVRLLAIGHAGQILVSETAAALVDGTLTEGVALAYLGAHQLKDLGRPVRVWQVVVPDEPRVFPPLRSLRTFRHNLPTQLTPLIARIGEIAEVDRLLSSERLVAITGSAGVGKTRLAPAEAVARFPGGAWWVDLASLSEGQSIGRAALAVLNIAETPTVRASVQLAAALGTEPSLLVLDNCEHLASDCAGLVTEILGVNPAVTVLATSREPLAVPGEVTWPVPSLKVPPVGGSLDPASLALFDAARLFVDRARRARPSFVVDEDAATAIGEICRRLDGIPLAIELAAARCRQMMPAYIRHELDDRFRVLTGGSRMALPRQRTLAASLDWSHDRLDVAEQRVFRRLGVFAGPFPLESAEAVVASVGDIATVDVLDLLTRLVDKNLVAVGEGVGGVPRYRLLETMRVYALDRADAAGELDGLRSAHARWWARWLADHFADLHRDTMLELVEEFHENLKSAVDWSTDDPELGLTLLALLVRPWALLGRDADALPVMDRLLTEEKAERFGLLCVTVSTISHLTVYGFRGLAAGDELLDSAERWGIAVGDEFQLTFVRWLNNGLQGTDQLVDLARARGDRYVAALALIANGRVLVDDDPQHARAVLEQDWEIARVEGCSYLTDLVRYDEARSARDLGELDRCLELASVVVNARSTQVVADAVWMLGTVGLLTMDEDAIIRAVEVAERRLPDTPGGDVSADRARSWLRSLTEDAPPTVSLGIDGGGVGAGSLWILCREALDAGEPELALSVVRAQANSGPHGRAVLAAVEGAVTGSVDRWHDALCLAAANGLRLVAVNALEAIAVDAARAESWSEHARLLAAAQRLRDDTGYRWRYRFERDALDAAAAEAREALGDQPAVAPGEEPLEWRETAAYAARARGERKRPRHGWASLTPTELRVVELVAQGDTNPQIAQRLLMGRATVKSHLEHVFTKLGVRTRAELAATAAGRTASDGTAHR